MRNEAGVAGPQPGDRVVLLDDTGHPCGTADRETIHSTRTPRHLAFSCWVVDPAGRVLVTRRALAKRSWAGVWSNSCCGHPRPGEELDVAVRRRVAEELRVGLADLECRIPHYSYRAVDPANGLVEDELCPVFVGTCEVEALDPDPAEVVESTWQAPRQLEEAMLAAPYAFTPWAREQWAELRRLGSIPEEPC